SGAPVGTFKEGNKSIPIVARLRPQDRAQLSQIKSLYVYSSQMNTRVPLLSVATVRNILETGRIRRREHFRTISILCFPAPGFLGVASLIGVIVSHVIVLFDFIEEMHEKGEPLERALPDAGIERIRPVMITVGATILALFPLALEGGPLWQPLCYAQIGGLAV